MNGDSQEVLIFGTIIMLVLLAFIIVFVMLYKRAQLKYKVEKQALQNEITKAETEIKQQILNEVSMDLHDDVGQLMGLLYSRLGAFKGLSEANTAILIQGQKLCREINNQIKVICGDLKDNRLDDLGLVGLIEKDVERLKRHGVFEVDLHLDQNINMPYQRNAMFLYRMFQESLNNIQKHSKADKIKIELLLDNEQLSLEIVDNGKGFDPSTVNRGHGLNNMEQRCEMIGAEFSLKSELDHGTNIKIKLPLEHEPVL